MKTGIVIFLCCVAATYCYSIADFADSLAEKIIAKREAERIFDEEENEPLENFEDDLTAGISEETRNPVEIAEPLVDFTKDEIAEPLVDFTKDEDVQQQVGNLIEAQPIFDFAVANEKKVNSPIKSDSETKKKEEMKNLLLPKPYKRVVMEIVAMIMLRMEKELPDWDAFSANAFSYTDLPMTEDAAIKDGWKLIKDACKESAQFVGRQYTKDESDKTRILLFDAGGKIAGMQMAFSNKLGTAVNLVGKVILDDGTNYFIAVYFTDPYQICEAGTKRRDNYVGENLYLQTTDKLMLIPYHEKNVLNGTKWVKGKCFHGMGQHYWYGIKTDMDCNDFFPIFLLYNQGILNGFGFATGSDITSSNVEHPTKPLLGLFFKPETQPKCLDNEPNLSTQHVYLQSSPRLNFC